MRREHRHPLGARGAGPPGVVSPVGWVLAFMLMSGAASGVERVPDFPPQEPYSRVRNALVVLGWQPVRMPAPETCTAEDARCRARPEMEVCAGTALGRCLFTWRKGDTLIAISTVAGSEPLVVAVECRAGCI